MAAFDPSTAFVDPQVGKLIELTKGYWTIVDDEDYGWLSEFKWCVTISKTSIYAVRGVRKQEHENRGIQWSISVLYMHCEIMNGSTGYANGIEVDHINVNGLDNRRRNLRQGDHDKNTYNRKKSSNSDIHSKYKGVYKSETDGRWCARTTHEKKTKFLGTFYFEEDAATAYDRRAKEVFGEYANTNLDFDDGRILIKSTDCYTKIPDSRVPEIRNRAADGEPISDIAKEFGVFPSAITRIVNRTRRKNIK
jgi:hypothetical protein